VTEKLYDELLTLPLHPGLTDAEIDAAVASVKEFLSNSSSLPPSPK
jgi:dTDP-4-amino-4,6-dideoxygalactose transaminase